MNSPSLALCYTADVSLPSAHSIAQLEPHRHKDGASGILGRRSPTRSYREGQWSLRVELRTAMVGLGLRPTDPAPPLPPPASLLTHSGRVEKYRPVVLNDVVGNTETIERLKIIAKDGNMPHVIISGMPGIGKTTSILCLARQLLGEAYKEAVLELNASDERGATLKFQTSGYYLGRGRMR